MVASDIFWVSTHSFAVVYTPQSKSDNTPNFVFLASSVSLLLLLALSAHAREGYSSHPVCLSVCLSHSDFGDY